MSWTLLAFDPGDEGKFEMILNRIFLNAHTIIIQLIILDETPLESYFLYCYDDDVFVF